MPRPPTTRQRSLEPSEVPQAQSSTAKEPLSPVLPDDGEKPVREKLQKTSIDAQAVEDDIDAQEPVKIDEESKEEDAAKSDEVMQESNDHLADPGKIAGLRRKRSAEELEEEGDEDIETAKNGKHVRKKTSADAAFQPPATDAQPAEPAIEPTGEDEDKSDDNSTEEMRSDLPEVGSQAMEDAPEDESSSDDGAVDSVSSTPERKTETMNDAPEAVLSSPKNKRNREQFLNDAVAEDSTEKQPTTTEKEDGAKALIGSEERSHKRQRSDSPSSRPNDTKEIPPITSTLTEAQPKSPPLTQTSESAFAASGFGALAKSTTSGFGALGKASDGKSPFASVAATTTDKRPSIFASTSSEENKTPASPSAFGGALGAKSPFAAVNATNASLGLSAFGSLGGASPFASSGFGSLGGGSKLSSFAGGSGPAITGLSSKPTKPFGAPADDDEEDGEEDGEEDEGSEIKSPGTEEDKKDPRFHEQEGKDSAGALLNGANAHVVATGEEGEDTLFSARAKLFAFVSEEENGKKDWRERGAGILKVNVVVGDESPKARLLMRADGSHRVVLNSPIHKDLKFGNANGEKPTGMTNLFLGTLPGQTQLVSMQLKVYRRSIPPRGKTCLTRTQMKPANAEELWENVHQIQQSL